MEILKENFEASLPLLQKAIAECDFVAMDTEMTGLSAPINNYKPQDSLATRYSKVTHSAASFLVVQLGICTFTWSDEIGGFEARPFNFPCFPSSADEAKAGERFFQCQSTSLEFLINNGFDFNKWIRHGIPYLTHPEEEAYIIRKTEKEAHNATASDTSNNIPVDDRNREFIVSTTAKIQEWLQSSEEETLTVTANNSFFRRLVYQIVRTDFNDELAVTSNAQARTMTLKRMTDEIRLQKEQARIPKPPTLNLRRVLDMIADAKKPLIGHNCFLDLMQISQQFLWDLPSELEEWKRLLNREWDTIIDTKHLASHPLVAPLLTDGTGLESVSKCVQKAPFATVGPKIVMATNFDRYQADASVIEVAAQDETATTVEKTSGKDNVKDETKYHEAGYDAYITGQAFLRFAGFILKKRANLAEDEDAEHTRKKRKVEHGESEGSTDSTPPSISDDSNIQDGQAAEEDEAEEGEVPETPMEKNALLEKRKRIILDNPTNDMKETEELRSYYNLLYMMRSDISIMNLLGPDEEPAERPWSFYLKNIPSSFQTSTLFHLFAPFNPHRFNWVDDTSAWIQLSRYAPAVNGEEASREPYEIKPLPSGALGEEYVSPFCVGDDEMAVKGRDAGVVMEAADIEIVAWKTWYDEREALARSSREMARQQQQQQQEQSNSIRFQKRPFRGPGQGNGALGGAGLSAPQALNEPAAVSSLPGVDRPTAKTVLPVENASSASSAVSTALEVIAGSKRKFDEDEVEKQQ
ncbi:hypothetical protein BGZ70_002906 [Mortierella alpina]|uniref:CAF1-domain-containing protein n=1 Tax=Mortierella alpina TaxID=64518 RepID=A0A9P6LWF0_MORAP|nr:hypothetical protein BGZ70_002906 [Mortierella alpina]